jgi:hypothetical protein
MVVHTMKCKCLTSKSVKINKLAHLFSEQYMLRNTSNSAKRFGKHSLHLSPAERLEQEQCSDSGAGRKRGQVP